MDVILCRNVLIYFTAEQRQKVAQQFGQSLLDGGWMIVAPCEIAQVCLPPFVMVKFPGTILHRKNRHATRPAAPPKITIPSFIPQTTVAPGFESQPASSSPVQADTFESVPSQFPDIVTEQEQQPTPYQEALAMYERGSYAEAAEKLAGLFTNSEYDNDEKVITLLAQVHATQGKLADALEWCEKAIIIEKLNPNFHYLHAIILQEQGQVDEAIMSLKRVLYLDQDFVLAHFALGHLTRQQGRLKESDKHFENALSFLNTQRREDVLPGSEGMTAGGLTEIIQSVVHRENMA